MQGSHGQTTPEEQVCRGAHSAQGTSKMKVESKFTLPKRRGETLVRARNLKMARSAHAYVRGNTVKFYEWLQSLKSGTLPDGPPVWICGDCHVGNLGPVANAQGQIEIQ